MAVKKNCELGMIHFLFKDRNLFYAHGFFYVLMFIIFRISMEFGRGGFHSYSENFDPFIIIFLVATLTVQVILFLSMLIKLFTKPNTQKLTSFLGLYIGIFVCFIWFAILVAYFENNDNSWGFNGLGFMLLSILPSVSSICGYILLILIKAIRSGICLLINKQNSEGMK